MTGETKDPFLGLFVLTLLFNANIFFVIIHIFCYYRNDSQKEFLHIIQVVNDVGFICIIHVGVI